MLNDKDIANDVISAAKAELSEIYKTALEASNPQLRQTLMEFANSGQQSQFQLYQLASQKGWYVPANPADTRDIQQVRQIYASPGAGAPPGAQPQQPRGPVM